MKIVERPLGRSGPLPGPVLAGLCAVGLAVCAGFAVLGGWVGVAGIALVLAAAIAGMLRWP
ncbi:hypothetical protein AB0L00_39330 [Actinoallomurus sp. NPDC052308]|uniref:hypothetical protein n=1 Tax=Actinoallomurus sp. NPDC052308 TaxID=3155530 RepID=UPI00341701D0